MDAEIPLSHGAYSDTQDEILEQYRKLLRNLTKIDDILRSIEEKNIPALTENLNLLDKKIAFVYMMFKTSIFAFLINEQQIGTSIKSYIPPIVDNDLIHHSISHPADQNKIRAQPPPENKNQNIHEYDKPIDDYTNSLKLDGPEFESTRDFRM
ncbi:DASH complex subunit DAD3 family protein ASCRUDRAFT_77128 [Ascoidea rubescens DSM 1968]|uniref:DASH complex subunit DAD3 n=1 Tax=Ascoidea rubescens DSM 1968 TaxID=1344418 RepID=A0A1D2VCD6_9ASCO|nr:hypothetical protein ASCRUDRAFT_77128 [Ascoidea rubescens DSM 1968]ODV59384.1 hypothetical protein ASCRUDRAFT_77128 [Ascoidea rubescens DSM 1968]